MLKVEDAAKATLSDLRVIYTKKERENPKILRVWGFCWGCL